MAWSHTVGSVRYVFDDLKTLLARATPERSGDQLAGIAARSAAERMAARWALADLPLAHFLNEAVVPYEADEVTRLIVDTHDAAAFAPVAHLPVGGLRDWLMYDCGDAVIGINPAGDHLAGIAALLRLLDELIQRHGIPTQGCVLTHVTNTMQLIEQGLPVDLVFQSAAGTQAANTGFVITLAMLAEARAAALSQNGGKGRGTSGRCWPTRWSASSVRSTWRTADRSFARAWKTTSPASCSACPSAATSATRTTPTPTATTWTR